MKNEHIAEILKECRKKNHYSVHEVAQLLQSYGHDPAEKTIYGWENAQSLPSADVLLTLCEIYHVSNVLETFGYKCSDKKQQLHLLPHECELIEAYRSRAEYRDAVDRVLECGEKTHRK